MRTLYFLLLLLAPLLLRAQGTPRPATDSSAPPAVGAAGPAAATAAPDTAAALRHLFARRRRNGHVSLGVGAGLLAASGVAIAIGLNASGYEGLAPFFGGVLGSLVGVPVFVRGVSLSIAYAEGREQRLVQAWQQHRLPRRVRRQLRPQDFEALPARPYQLEKRH